MSSQFGSADEAVPRSVGRAFELLEIVVGEIEVNLSAAAAQADLTPTTALRHLRALESLGYVRRNPSGNYSAGPAVLRLGKAARDDGPLARLVDSAQPVLDHLTAETGESSYLAIAEGVHAVYLATAESSRSIRHVGWVGKQVPRDGTAIGEALDGYPDVRIRTGAVETDITAVARAVADEGAVVAALSVIGPSHRMGEPARTRCAEAVAAAASRLGSDLGFEQEAVS